MKGCHELSGESFIDLAKRDAAQNVKELLIQLFYNRDGFQKTYWQYLS